MVVVDVLRNCLADPEAGWSMGGFGAIAEFHQDIEDIIVVDHPSRLVRGTTRGAILIDVERLSKLVAIAYEIPSPRPHRWSQGISLCLPEETARRTSRDTLTELGADRGAIRSEDADAILFDIGLGLPQCDFCVRTSEPELIEIMRANLGRSIFDSGNLVMHAIVSKHPHRVALTNLGRVEVYQKIGGPETGGVSPPGPHTHLLPKLLKTRRTHSANTPIPEGLVPVAYVHPGNPVYGPLGVDRPFDFNLHTSFQQLMRAFGPRDYVRTKERLISSLMNGLDPDAFELPDDRFHRLVARVTLRQFAHISKVMDSTELATRVQRWRRKFDDVFEMTAEDPVTEHN